MRSLTLVLVLVAGCYNATRVTGTDAWFNQASYSKPALAQRASFDLSCPREQLNYQKLGTDWQTVGVVGCDRHATYVYNSYQGVWVMNSDARAASN